MVKDVTMKIKPRYLGTSHNGKYSYHLSDDGYVYQENIFGRNVGWLCRYPSWERTMHKILDKE